MEDHLLYLALQKWHRIHPFISDLHQFLFQLPPKIFEDPQKNLVRERHSLGNSLTLYVAHTMNTFMRLFLKVQNS